MAEGIEQQYLNSLREILEHGEEKHPERKLEAGRKLSHYTKGVSCIALQHYMSDGFPLMTHKKMGLKTIAVELEGFIKGITDKKWFQERNCHIWDEWANPVKVKEIAIQKQNDERVYSGDFSIVLTKEAIAKIQKEENDLGPLGYSWNWRKFGQHYDTTWAKHSCDKGVDQLAEIVDSLKNNPNDRRMVCSAWNPNQFPEMALPPCHMMWGVSHWNGKLDLWWIQRSCDALLGVPYNIASYALLLLLLAKESGLTANKLTGWMVDYHLYSNQFEAAQQAIDRPIFPLPTVQITGQKSIFDWTYEDFLLKDYQCGEPLEKVEVVI